MSSVLTGVYENKREDERLPNKSIKELKAENKELAELKFVCLLKLKNRMKKLNRLKAENERERGRNELLKQEMAFKLACLKSKGKAIWKRRW